MKKVFFYEIIIISPQLFMFNINKYYLQQINSIY